MRRVAEVGLRGRDAGRRDVEAERVETRLGERADRVAAATPRHERTRARPRRRAVGALVAAVRRGGEPRERRRALDNEVNQRRLGAGRVERGARREAPRPHRLPQRHALRRARGDEEHDGEGAAVEARDRGACCLEARSALACC